ADRASQPNAEAGMTFPQRSGLHDQLDTGGGVRDLRGWVVISQSCWLRDSASYPCADARRLTGVYAPSILWSARPLCHPLSSVVGHASYTVQEKIGGDA